MKKTVLHITSAHPALDSRIFYKECLALHNAGYEVMLVAPKSNDHEYLGIKIYALNETLQKTRWRRLYGIYRLANSIAADIYHFHDPEFIPFALLFKLSGKKVIYDVHEDTPKESLSFNKNRKMVRLLKYFRWHLLEKLASLSMDGFACATEQIAKKFPPTKTQLVRNFVKLDEFNLTGENFEKRANTLLYVGAVMRTRGLEQMLNSISNLSVDYECELKLIGNFMPRTLLAEARQLAGWDRVTTTGQLDRAQLIPHFYQAKVGLVLLHPEANFKEALPIKLFEYMAAGLPVIASDFPIWREIISSAKCGLLVDPFDIKAIQACICYLFDHPEIASKMGAAGRAAVQKKYDWRQEALQLNKLYDKLMGGRR